MIEDNADLRSLRVLILKAQRESLSDAEIQQLNQWMQTESGATEAAALLDQLAAFTDSSGLDSPPIASILSESFFTETPPTPGGVALVESPPIRHRKTIYWWLAIVASHLIIASLAWSLAESFSANQQASRYSLEPAWPNKRNLSPSTTSSPQLVSMTACVWQPSGEEFPSLGETLQSGKLLKLVEGIAELKINQGTSDEALVRIEGPASAYVRSNGQLGFLDGSLTARSFGSGNGSFTIGTPMGEVIVAGQSSMGLVANESVCEFHLFDGQALVKPHQATSETKEISLLDGEAVRISSESTDELTIVRFQASEATFVSARSPGFDPLNLSDAYVNAVMESKPNAYWRFEELVGENPRYVANQGSDAGMNAIVQGSPGWRQYGNNRVADLGTGTSSAFLVQEPWPKSVLDDYAIEMWVKPLLFHHGEIFCLHDPEELDDGRHAHAMMLEVTAQHHYTHRLKDSPANRFRFVHRELGSPQPISATSLFSDDPYQARVWQHVVVQKLGHRQMIWVDGQLAAERENTVPLSPNVRVLIGQVYPNAAVRRFAGQIDEVALYDRFLPPQEIRSHIRAAGRKVKSKSSE